MIVITCVQSQFPICWANVISLIQCCVSCTIVCHLAIVFCLSFDLPAISLLTDFVCLYNYEFGLSLCKIVRSSVILLLPLFESSNFCKFSLYDIVCVTGVSMFDYLNSRLSSNKSFTFLIGSYSKNNNHVLT